MGKLNLKLGCLVYPCFSCSTFLFTEKSLHKDLPVVILRYFYIIRKTKRFAIPERAVYFLKTKRTAGGTPPPQNIFDRLTPVFT